MKRKEKRGREKLVATAAGLLAVITTLSSACKAHTSIAEMPPAKTLLHIQLNAPPTDYLATYYIMATSTQPDHPVFGTFHSVVLMKWIRRHQV